MSEPLISWGLCVWAYRHFLLPEIRRMQWPKSLVYLTLSNSVWVASFWLLLVIYN